MAATKVDELFAELSLKADAFYSGMSKAESRFNASGKKLANIGRSMTQYVSLPLAAAAGMAVKFATDFNASMADVATLIPGNTERVNELKDAVQNMAIETGKDTEDLAVGLYQTVSAFGDSAESADRLRIAARAAIGGTAQTTDAINLLSATTKGYGDTSTAAMEQVSDLAFQTVKLGQTTFPELAASIGKVVPLAQELGVAQEELFAVMATGTGVTGSTSEVSTQFRGVLQSLMNPTESLSSLIAELGYDSATAMLQTQGLGGTIQAIVDAAKTAGVPLQKYIGQIEGQTLALALAGEQSDDYIEKLAQMEDSAGAADDAFAAQTEGVNAFGQTLKKLKAIGTVVMQELGDAIVEALDPDTVSNVTDSVVSLTKAFGDLSPETKTLIIKLGAIAIAAGPVISAIAKLAALGPVLGSAIAALANPIGIIILALASLGAAITAVLEATGDSWSAVWHDAGQTLSDVGAWISATTGAIVASVQGMGNSIVASVKSRFTQMQQIATSAVRAVANAFKWLKDVVVGHSYIPDMVTEVKDWMLRLGSDALVDPATAATEEGAEAFARMNADIRATIADLGQNMLIAEKQHQVWGDAVDVNAQQAQALEQAINSLINDGMAPGDPVIGQLVAQHTALTAVMEHNAAAARNLGGAVGSMASSIMAAGAAAAKTVGDLSRTMQEFAAKTSLAEREAEVFGNSSLTLLQAKADAARSAIVELLQQGFDASSPVVQDLSKQYEELCEQIDLLNQVTETATALHEAWAGVLGDVAKNAIAAVTATNRINLQPIEANMNNLKGAAKAAFQEMEGASYDWGSAMTGVFADVLGRGQSVFGALSSAAASYFGIPAELAGLAEPVLNAVWEGLEWAGDKLWRGVSWVAEKLNPFNWFATGGTMRATGTAVVGERGPEIVNLPAGATVTPMSDIGGGGPMTIQLLIDGRTMAQTTTRYMPGILRVQGVTR